MVLAWLFGRKHKKIDDAAYRLYVGTITQSRAPMLYERMDVEDSLEGRFDSLVLHLSMLMHRLNAFEDKDMGEKLGQRLFDLFIQNMDQSLREKGVGDMGVPRRMRNMIEAFNGRHTAYRAAFVGVDDAQCSLKDVLVRNLYSGGDVDNVLLEDVCAYVTAQVKRLEELKDCEVLEGDVLFLQDTNKTEDDEVAA